MVHFAIKPTVSLFVDLMFSALHQTVRSRTVQTAAAHPVKHQFVQLIIQYLL